MGLRLLGISLGNLGLDLRVLRFSRPDGRGSSSSPRGGGADRSCGVCRDWTLGPGRRQYSY